MSINRILDRYTNMVPPEERARFRRELGEHMRNTFFRWNMLADGALAFGIGILGEKAVDGAVSATEGVWGLGPLHDKWAEFAGLTYVEHMPEIFAAAAVTWRGVRNYLEYRRLHRKIRRELENFSIDFMGQFQKNRQLT